MAVNKNPHAKHRERVRNEFMSNNFNLATPEHKILEMLLFFSIPRIDTNEIAHALITRFGSLARVIDAKPEELKQVKGIGDNSATLIKLINTVCKVYTVQKFEKGHKPSTVDEVGERLQKIHFGFTNEIFAVTSFNSKGELIATDFITEGDVTSVGVTSRMVIEKLVERRAASAIISHNHPDGNAMPSDNDIAMTIRVAKAMAHINIPLVDHIIVVNDDHVSLRQSSQFRKIFEYRPE